MSYRYQQLVSQPTHFKGHTLDLVIVREDDESVEEVKVIHSMPSDHAAITFTLCISQPPDNVKRIQVRKLRHINVDNFESDIVQSFGSQTNLDEMDIKKKVDMNNKTLSSILDRHAPEMRRNVQMRHYAPWYNDTFKELKQNLYAKERIWRKSEHRSPVM